MNIAARLDALIFKRISLAPLAIFRIVFGLMMLISIIRFWYRGWIFEQYVVPDYYFSYFGFEWVQPLSDGYIQIIFWIMGISAACVALGLAYRLASLSFFLSFTYVELIDKTNYLNHYYFVSIVALLMIVLPAHRYFSIDSLLFPKIKASLTPAWTINAIKLQLGIVYFFAGIAKLNSDWMLHALPLKIWLPAKTSIPVIGPIFQYEWIAYLFSWSGALYDIFIVFFLIYPPTRLFAYITVIIFHGLTAILFNIGMFPLIMIASTLIFFSADAHERVLRYLGASPITNTTYRPKFGKLTPAVLSMFFLIQLLLPMRYLAYPGNLYWTEQGYRFSWRVMLMEKAGYASFFVSEQDGSGRELVQNADYLTPYQEKMVSTQPDMILQYAEILDQAYRDRGYADPRVTADIFVTLNGRRSQRFVDPDIDLSAIQDGFHHKTWLLPLQHDQTGD